MIEKFIAPVTNLLDKFIADADTKQKIAHEIEQCLNATRRKSHWLRSKSTKQKQKETGSKQDGDQQQVGFACWVSQ